MSKNKVALILSIVCCGLGQIYNSEVLKGIILMVLSAALIVTPIFFPPHLPSLRSISIAVVIFLWLVGMLDAYTSAGGFMEEKPRLVLLWIRSLLLAVVIFAAIVTIGLIMLWPQRFPTEYQNSSVNEVAPVLPNVTEEVKPDASTDTEILEESQSDIPQLIMDYEDIPETKPHFTIQVGAFTDENTAKSTAINLREKKYSVHIIRASDDAKTNMYKVRLGYFENEDKARKTAERMLKNGEVDTAIIVYVKYNDGIRSEQNVPTQ